MNRIQQVSNPLHVPTQPSKAEAIDFRLWGSRIRVATAGVQVSWRLGVWAVTSGAGGRACNGRLCSHLRSFGTLPQVALIDFTASRLVTTVDPASGGAEVAFYDLNQDPEVFEGTSGDVQVWMEG